MDIKVKPRGRQTIYSIELVDEICNAISCSNIGLAKLCDINNHWPSLSTIMNWLSGVKIADNTYLVEQYARAREAQADYLADEMVLIADSPLIGKKTKETKDGTFEEIGDNVDRSRLMIDTRKWAASKLKPKKYGDKIDLTSGGKELKPFDVAAALGAFMGSATPINTIDITAQELEQERLEQPKNDTNE